MEGCGGILCGSATRLILSRARLEFVPGSQGSWTVLVGAKDQ